MNKGSKQPETSDILQLLNKAFNQSWNWCFDIMPDKQNSKEKIIHYKCAYNFVANDICIKI